MKTYQSQLGDGLPRHMCSVILGGACSHPGLPPHEVQMHSRDDFAVLLANLVAPLLGRSTSKPLILDVDTETGDAEAISAAEAHRRFAPACLKAHPPEPPEGGSSKANSRDN